MVRWPPSAELKPASVAKIAVRRSASRRLREVVAEASAFVRWVETAPVQPDEKYFDEAQRGYLGQRLAAAMASLPPGQASALAMFAEDLPQDEIARRLGVKRGTVASWIMRARAKLRWLLADLAAA
jgi:RNA polymerase sigma factor (sigma-70 family)